MSLVGYGHIIGEAGVPPIRSGSLIVLGYELSFVPYPTRLSDLEGTASHVYGIEDLYSPFST